MFGEYEVCRWYTIRNKGGIDMAKHETNINIYGGNVQVMPNVREVEQYIHTKDGETVIINKFKL